MDKATIVSVGFIAPTEGKTELPAPAGFTSPAPSLSVMEEAYILYVLNQTGWNKAKSAKILGIDTSTLYRKIDRYKLKDKAGMET